MRRVRESFDLSTPDQTLAGAMSMQFKGLLHIPLKYHANTFSSDIVLSILCIANVETKAPNTRTECSFDM